MNALAGFLTPISIAIFVIGIWFAPSWLALLWLGTVIWFLALVQIERARAPRLIDRQPESDPER